MITEYDVVTYIPCFCGSLDAFFLFSSVFYYLTRFIFHHENLFYFMKLKDLICLTYLLYMLYRFQVSEIHAGHLWDSYYFCGCQATCLLSLTSSKNYD